VTSKIRTSLEASVKRRKILLCLKMRERKEEKKGDHAADQ
jgi:hypothetical protein